jgi:ParB/RepB/Spo0J family partition protein
MATLPKEELADSFRYERQLKYVPLDLIDPNDENPRQPPSRTEVDDLCESIQIVGGILVPLVVYFDAAKERYVILDGERRFHAAKRLGLKRVPVNILPTPPDLYTNLRTMFNIHLQREAWNPAAKALTLDKIIKLRPEDDDEKLHEQTGISAREIQDLKRLLKPEMPKQLVGKALNETLQSSFLIEMEKYLEPCEKAFPDVFNDLSLKQKQEIRFAFMAKVDAGWINSNTEFRSLGGIRRLCIKGTKSRDEASRVFERALKRMLVDIEYSPDMALQDLKLKYQPEVRQTFSRSCAEFLGSLKAFAKTKTREEEFPSSVRRRLTTIKREIERLLK